MSLPPLAPFDSSLPLDRAHTLPANWYTDPAVLEAERRQIFARSWQCIGRAEQVAKPGEYLTADIAGEPVLVVRGDDGTLRGFFNVCRHRAAPILNDDAGCVGKLRCRYHGWTYDLAGRLKGTPEWDGVCDFEKNANGLLPVGGVEVLGQWVWVSVEKPVRGVVEEFSRFADELGVASALQFHARRTYDLACNWKVYIDNYLDGGYHVHTVHPALAGAIDYQHYRTHVFDRYSLQTSPLGGGSGDVAATRTGTAAYWWLWPNFMVNISDGVMDTNLVLPLGVDRCRVIFDFYFAPDVTAEFQRQSVAVADQVQAEDVLICEQVQCGLGSRSYRTGRFSVKREAAGYAFQCMVAASLEPGTE
ncbi:MAG: aromatic ring-hydroxylating dioxygenase subunit alpha [Fimbriiglobus sp.]|jgi:choline monooxygenase|nr:aromatic ring-hydroxylating dioxygenase subunit alpha [Fimbriiglobus sp.]